MKSGAICARMMNVSNAVTASITRIITVHFITCHVLQPAGFWLEAWA